MLISRWAWHLPLLSVTSKIMLCPLSIQPGTKAVLRKNQFQRQKKKKKHLLSRKGWEVVRIKDKTTQVLSRPSGRRVHWEGPYFGKNMNTQKLFPPCGILYFTIRFLIRIRFILSSNIVKWFQPVASSISWKGVVRRFASDTGLTPGLYTRTSWELCKYAQTGLDPRPSESESPRVAARDQESTVPHS